MPHRPAFRTAFLGLAALVTLAGCDAFGSDAAAGEATALKDGAPWQAVASSQMGPDQFYLALSVREGTCLTDVLAVMLPVARFDGVGTYALSPAPGPQGVYQQLTACSVLLESGWHAAAESHVEITRYDRRGTEGRFTLTLVSESQTDTLRFTEGRFHAPFLPGTEPR